MDELNNECNNVEEDKINDSYTSYESNTQNCTELVNKSCSENIVEEVDKTTKNTENLIRELSAEDQDGSSVVITTSKQSSSNDLIEKSEHSFLKQSGNSRTNEDDFVDENMTKFFSNETEDNKMDKNSGNSEENFKNKNKSDNCKSPINNLVFENSDISSDNIIIKNEEETDGTACENNFAENSFSPKTHQKSPVHKLLEDVTNSDDTDVEEKIELPCRETKTDKNIDNELCETTKKLMIQIPDVNDSNYVPDNDFDEDLASETSNENDDSDTEIVTNNTENDKLLENVKSELEGNDDLSDVEKNNDNTNLKNVAETNINVLNYVNTNLPNTELSNIDISNLDVNKPVDIVDRNQSEASHSDLIDDLSDFIGFDSSSAEKTVQIIQILHERQEKLEQSLQNTFSKEESDDTVDSDYQLKMNSENEEVNNEINSITSLKEEQTKVSRENDSIVSANKINYVYELTKEINIFEEQVPSGSKRVKKKKKFFGDFEDTDDISSKKQNVSKEHAETSKLVNNFGENKENVIADDKLKEEVISENESMVTTPSSIPPVSKVQNKPKRVFFDISNPLFREPFKYGWKREICYRNLPEGSKSKSAYVSYFNPLGKKFKTIRQIVEHLPPGSQLNMKHFTFSKERIFSEEEASDFEVIRRMKTSTGLNETETSNKTIGSDNPEYNGSVSSEEQSKLNSKKKASSSRSKVVGNTSFNENEISTPKLKISKRPKTKQEESEEEMAETTIGSSSKMTMPKILIRGVSSNSKSGSLKFKVSSGKSSSHKKAKKSKKVSDRSSKCKEMAKSSDEMEDESLTENESSLTYVSTSSFPMSTSNQTSTRSLKRKHSDDIDVALCRDKIPKLDSQFSSSTFRTSLTLSNICCLYDPLILCLKYLTVRELLRVSMTCKYLNRLASDSSLWTIVRLKNSKITDWEGFGRALQKHGTKRLDMRKMLCPTAIDDLETMWNNFFEVIPNIKSLEHIDFMRCTSNVVHKVAQTCLNLTVINAVQLKSSMPSLDSFTKLKYLRELRLRGLQSLNMETNESKLNFICNDTLQVLSLTSIKNLNVDTLEAISELQNLHTLELGECESLPNNFSEIIGKLYKLERLRLEKVTNLDPEYSIFAVLRNLQHFKYLELINFEVKVGFDQAIATCQNIEKFLLIPLYLHQSATANKVIVNGLQKLSKTLKCFVWGLTTELLKVTGIFVDQYQGKHNDGDSNSKNGDMGCAKKHFDCIPILKALSSEGNNTPEVDILSVSSLEKILTKMLPQARVKVLKMPYSLTWRQSLSECFK